MYIYPLLVQTKNALLEAFKDFVEHFKQKFRRTRSDIYFLAAACAIPYFIAVDILHNERHTISVYFECFTFNLNLFEPLRTQRFPPKGAFNGKEHILLPICYTLNVGVGGLLPVSPTPLWGIAYPNQNFRICQVPLENFFISPLEILGKSYPQKA
jgi:hypothetical protein